MIQLSTVVITFNEEKNIARCIDSVLKVSDEVIVIDSYSTDNTKKICIDKNVKFVEHKFENYIEQKNWALSQTKYNYVLSLDADEAIDNELETEILKIKNNWQSDGYFINRLTNYCGKWIYFGGWYPDRKLRLFDKTKCKWGGVNPHDKIEFNAKNPKLEKLNGKILHYSFYTIEDHKTKIKKYSEIAAKAYLLNGIKGSYLKIVINPTVKFIKTYILKLGIFDGYYGWKIATLSAFETYLKYKKLIDIQK